LKNDFGSLPSRLSGSIVPTPSYLTATCFEVLLLFLIFVGLRSTFY